MLTINTPEHRQSLLANNHDQLIAVACDVDEKQHADAAVEQKQQHDVKPADVTIAIISTPAEMKVPSNTETPAAAYATMRAHFFTGATRTLAWRLTQLRNLRRLVSENVPALEGALLNDLKKSGFDSQLTEIGEGRMRHRHRHT